MFGLESLIGIGGSMLGGGLSGLFGGGDEFDPLAYMNSILFGGDGKGGINKSMHKQIQRTNKVYNWASRQAGEMGRAGRQQIGDWRKNTNAAGDLSLASRGLYNTTVADSMHQNVGAQANRLRAQLSEDVMRNKIGYRLGGNAATNNLWSELHNYQMMPAQAAFGSYSQGRNAAAGQAASNWGNLATQLIGGSFPGGAPGAGSGGQAWWQMLGGLFS